MSEEVKIAMWQLREAILKLNQNDSIAAQGRLVQTVMSSLYRLELAMKEVGV